MERNVVNVDENVVTYEYLFNDEERRAEESLVLKRSQETSKCPVSERERSQSLSFVLGSRKR